MTQPNISFEDAIAELTGEGGRFEIVDTEIRGETYKTFKATPPSLRDAYQLAKSRGDTEFLVYEDERYSFGDVIAKAEELAAALVETHGVKKGDRVAIAMRNYPEWIISFVAITSMGGIAVCMNAWWTTEEMQYGLEDSGAKLLIADRERMDRVHGLLDVLDARCIAVRCEGELPPRTMAWEDALEPGGAFPDIEIAPDDDATILYTSGTTGHPKGAVSTHRAILSALLSYACRAASQQLMYPPKEPSPYRTCFILCVPLFHVTGLIPVMMSCLLGGFKLVIMYKWVPERALELIERERITQFVGVPTMSWDMLESPDFEKYDTSSLSSIGGGGAPAPPELVSRIDKSFKKGAPGIGYGMTETCAYGPQNSGADYLRKPRSAGRTVPTMEVKVADETGKELPRGEVGEIMFKGPNLIRGYWNKPEATADTFLGAWLKSGDLGRMDDEGFIFVEDRAKDMVLRAGENIYSAEVEAVIYEFEGIHEAAVFGLPHERLGEELAVAIVPKKGVTLDVDALKTHIGQHLASFKIPSYIELHDEQLPRNASGKILKRSLRDEIVARREA
jgi:long-chain acyl-CoA synthetase